MCDHKRYINYISHTCKDRPSSQTITDLDRKIIETLKQPFSKTRKQRNVVGIFTVYAYSYKRIYTINPNCS